MNQDEKSIAKAAAFILLAGTVLGVLLVLDLLNRGLIWRMLRSLKDPNATSLPGEKRTIGNSYQTDITFLT